MLAVIGFGLSGHICFASGIHSCLGMHPARIETKAMLNSLFCRGADVQPVSAT
jgi:cytochrome P450